MLFAARNNHPEKASSGEKVPRRTFLNVLLGGGVLGWLIAVLYPVVSYFIPPAESGASTGSVKAATTDELVPDSAKIFKFGRKPGLLLRLKNGEYRAFIAICTHLACTVQYRKDMGVIWCACHNGKFNLKGINISGPPPRPLDPLEVHIKGEDIFVSKAEE